MLNLMKYYKENVLATDYYYKFYDCIIDFSNTIINDDLEVLESNISQFDFFDDDEIIEKFKHLCQPNTDVTSKINMKLFYLICFYLYKNGYYLEEFPNILKRPPDNPSDFTYNEIRSKLLSMGKGSNGVVRYATRRTFVADLTFRRNSYVFLEEDIDYLFEKISTRNARFNSMSENEKLKELGNLIENMLLHDEKFKKLDYSDLTFNYINDDIVKDFRNKVQCFRHASDEALEERQSFSNEQKKFLIDYGIIIIKSIYTLLKNQKK